MLVDKQMLHSLLLERARARLPDSEKALPYDEQSKGRSPEWDCMCFVRPPDCEQASPQVLHS